MFGRGPRNLCGVNQGRSLALHREKNHRARRAATPPVTAMGRPSKLTPEVHDRVVALIRAGTGVEAAVRACGIAPSTHYAWALRHPAYREAVEQARAEGEVHRVAQITVAARADWRAAAWFLEREFPEP
jgi:hypothetical protein